MAYRSTTVIALLALQAVTASASVIYSYSFSISKTGPEYGFTYVAPTFLQSEFFTSTPDSCTTPVPDTCRGGGLSPRPGGVKAQLAVGPEVYTNFFPTAALDKPGTYTEVSVTDQTSNPKLSIVDTGVSPAPEPSTLALLSLPIVGLFLFRRKRLS